MKRTSRSIQRKIVRLSALTVHISPFMNGLAPETYDFVAALNAEAARRKTGVEYVALANKIQARCKSDPEALERAARSQGTLGGWFLRQGLVAGHAEGEEVVLRRGNSQHRKKLRKEAKTKAQRDFDAAVQELIDERLKFRWKIEDIDPRVTGGIVPANWPKAWVGGHYRPLNEPHNRPKRMSRAE
jgi:hypothetical protein